MKALELFDIKPKQNMGVIEKTEIEYMQLAFSKGKKTIRWFNKR